MRDYQNFNNEADENFYSKPPEEKVTSDVTVKVLSLLFDSSSQNLQDNFFELLRQETDTYLGTVIGEKGRN